MAAPAKSFHRHRNGRDKFLGESTVKTNVIFRMQAYTPRGPKGRLPHKRGIKAPKEFPARPELPAPRRVRCFSESHTGISLPKQKREEVGRGRKKTGASRASSSAASGRETRPTTAFTPDTHIGSASSYNDDGLLLQAQLAALGIELPLHVVRERVRMAEHRLAFATESTPDASRRFHFGGMRLVGPHNGEMQVRMPQDTPNFSTSRQQRQRPSTARARLENHSDWLSPATEIAGVITATEIAGVNHCEGDDWVVKPAQEGDLAPLNVDVMDTDTSAQSQFENLLTPGKESISPVLSEHSTSDIEEFVGEASSSLVSTTHEEAIVDAARPEADSPVQAFSKEAVLAACGDEYAGIPTQKEWEHGSLWEWGNPNASTSQRVSDMLTAAPQMQAVALNPSRPKSATVNHVPKLALLPHHNGPVAVTARPSAQSPSRPSFSRASERPASARPSTTGGKKSKYVGLSPRTNLREAMGIWACPNTPGPGAYNVAERKTQGGNCYVDVRQSPRERTRRLTYGRTCKLGSEPRFTPTPSEVSCANFPACRVSACVHIAVVLRACVGEAQCTQAAARHTGARWRRGLGAWQRGATRRSGRASIRVGPNAGGGKGGPS